VIEMVDVAVRLGRTEVLRGLSVVVAPGEVVGLVGPNGAGKTTALRVLTGYLAADAGTVRVAGHDLGRDRRAALSAIGYLPESVPLYPDMRVDEYLDFRARLRGVPRALRAERKARLLDRLDLGGLRRRLIGRLSRGMRQRVGLADALIAEPAVLLLDEPTTGLDPVQAREFRAVLAELAGEHTILLSSHVLSELEQIASRLVVMSQGRAVGDGTPAALREQLGLAADAPLEQVFFALAGGKDAA
jgi:ABC-2 type transport system ATP-binding protein